MSDFTWQSIESCPKEFIVNLYWHGSVCFGYLVPGQASGDDSFIVFYRDRESRTLMTKEIGIPAMWRDIDVPNPPTKKEVMNA